jgi:hypothetical protein
LGSALEIISVVLRGMEDRSWIYEEERERDGIFRMRK